MKTMSLCEKNIYCKKSIQLIISIFFSLFLVTVFNNFDNIFLNTVFFFNTLFCHTRDKYAFGKNTFFSIYVFPLIVASK